MFLVKIHILCVCVCVCVYACACLVPQSCPTLSNPMHCSLPGSSARQEYWSGLPFPTPADSLPLSHLEALKYILMLFFSASQKVRARTSLSCQCTQPSAVLSSANTCPFDKSPQDGHSPVSFYIKQMYFKMGKLATGKEQVKCLLNQLSRYLLQ